MSVLGESALSPEQRKKIDALCDAMDKEDLLARSPFCQGRTPLDLAREFWTKRVLDGKPLPVRWCNDQEEASLQERLQTWGTREWRQAFPELYRESKEKGLIVE